MGEGLSCSLTDSRAEDGWCNWIEASFLAPRAKQCSAVQCSAVQCQTSDGEEKGDRTCGKEWKWSSLSARSSPN